SPASDELLIEGQRVLVDGHRLIAPWSERVRYGVKKNGYHGGLTPQEMVIPIAVLSSTDDIPVGWQEQPVDIPIWWDEPAGDPEVLAAPTPQLKPAPPQNPGLLFEKQAEPKASAPAGDSSPEWVNLFLKSPVYDEQKQLAGRGVPADELLAKLLSSLDQRGGKLTSVALARALAFPEVRLPGLLAKAQRILNVDGYA
ncbi:MAG: BREX-2 system phosphatase PglZ, partial [Planctomycetota bacterium]